ncbi:MAG: O-methyltransferase [Pseudonocardiaceae bacterium]
MRDSSGSVLGSAVSGAAIVTLAMKPDAPRVVRWALWACTSLGTAVAANQLAGKPVPFLRWSVLRMMLGQRRLFKEWQVGDGREKALATHVVTHARRGDLDDVIRVIDDFCYHRSFMMNIGDEKGEILDRAVQRTQPHRLLELGTYCGYSALRTIRAMPSDAHLYSIEFSPANADIARRIWDHAGVGDRVTVVVGYLGDGGSTLDRLQTEHGFTDGSLDLVFVDHDKAAYLPDVQHMLRHGWLHPGSVVVADNVKYPGAPEYRAYMTEQEGKSWRTTEHRTHLEYQSLFTDLVLESEYLGGWMQSVPLNVENLSAALGSVPGSGGEATGGGHSPSRRRLTRRPGV